MKIRLSHPDGPYEAFLDPGVMEVEIREAFLGVGFVTEGGARLAVSMRDDGFEVHYWIDGDLLADRPPRDVGWTDFKNGEVQRR